MGRGRLQQRQLPANLDCPTPTMRSCTWPADSRRPPTASCGRRLVALPSGPGRRPNPSNQQCWLANALSDRRFALFAAFRPVRVTPRTRKSWCRQFDSAPDHRRIRARSTIVAPFSVAASFVPPANTWLGYRDPVRGGEQFDHHLRPVGTPVAGVAERLGRKPAVAGRVGLQIGRREEHASS
jgi:hypothetical protein